MGQWHHFPPTCLSKSSILWRMLCKMASVTQLSGGRSTCGTLQLCLHRVKGHKRVWIPMFPGQCKQYHVIWTLYAKPSQIVLNHSQKCTRSQKLAQTYSIELFRGNHQNSAMLNRHQTFLATVTKISRDHRISASSLTKTPCWKYREAFLVILRTTAPFSTPVKIPPFLLQNGTILNQ